MIELMTTEDVANFFKVKRSTVDSWVNRKQLPESIMFKIVGKKSPRRFIKSRLEEWVLNGSLQEE